MTGKTDFNSKNHYATSKGMEETHSVIARVSDHVGDIGRCQLAQAQSPQHNSIDLVELHRRNIDFIKEVEAKLSEITKLPEANSRFKQEIEQLDMLLDELSVAEMRLKEVAPLFKRPAP